MISCTLGNQLKNKTGSKTMKKWDLKDFLLQAMIAAMYYVLVLVFQFLSFEAIQFRIAEVLLILVFFDKKTIVGLTIGTFFANWHYAPAGIVDAVFGSLATVISLGFMILFIKRKWLALIFPVVVNGIYVGLLLVFTLDLPFFINFLLVSFGQAAVLYGLGLPLYYALRKNKGFLEFFK
jgi:uncharacterized membrane protein